MITPSFNTEYYILNLEINENVYISAIDFFSVSSCWNYFCSYKYAEIYMHTFDLTNINSKLADYILLNGKYPPIINSILMHTIENAGYGFKNFDIPLAIPKGSLIFLKCFEICFALNADQNQIKYSDIYANKIGKIDKTRNLGFFLRIKQILQNNVHKYSFKFSAINPGNYSVSAQFKCGSLKIEDKSFDVSVNKISKKNLIYFKILVLL